MLFSTLRKISGNWGYRFHNRVATGFASKCYAFLCGDFVELILYFTYIAQF